MALTLQFVTLVVTLVQFSEPERCLNEFHSLFSKGAWLKPRLWVLGLRLITV